MKISRKLAIQILRYCENNKDFYFPFFVVCKEYTLEDSDFVKIEPSELSTIENDKNYKTFELWENLQNLYKETVELMARGFIEKITNSKNTLKDFIFYTSESCTFKPNSESNMSDVENYQILGWGKGCDFKEALDGFKKENSWLENSGFNKIIGSELKGEKSYCFNLNK